VVVVLTSGSALAVPWINANVPAIIQAWYPGQRGDAVADVVFGDYNPAGRLPVTFYNATDDLPDFSNYNMHDRTYRYYTGKVLYPFGHGLSYSTFAYSGLTVPKIALTEEEVKVTVTVKNTSAVAGDEVVQCYINRDLPAVDPKSIPADIATLSEADATRLALPRKQLVGFQRLALKAGEQKQVTFTITPQQLAVVGAGGNRRALPGNFTVQVGGSSADGLKAALAVEGGAHPPEYHFVGPVVK
jgi:beta-glucosidase